VILSFRLLRVNDRDLEVRADLETFENGWEVRARVRSREDLRYLAGLFATSSEPVHLEFEATKMTPRSTFKAKRAWMAFRWIQPRRFDSWEFGGPSGPRLGRIRRRSWSRRLSS
jgi:hypothetical protein